MHAIWQLKVSLKPTWLLGQCNKLGGILLIGVPPATQINRKDGVMKLKSIVIFIMVMGILAIGAPAFAKCNDIYGCNPDGCDIMEAQKTKNANGDTFVIIKVINEVDGKSVKRPIVRLGKPYATRQGGTPCWKCAEGHPAWSWKRGGTWAFEKRPQNGTVTYKVKKWGGDRVSQSDPKKTCIWVYKPGCNYKVKGIVTVHMGYNNIYEVYLDCPLRIKVE